MSIAISLRRAGSRRPLRRLTLFVTLLASLAAPGLSHAATVQFGNTVPGITLGCPPSDYKYGNAFALGQGGFVTSIQAVMKGSAAVPGGSQVFRTMVYAADGPSGGPGTLLAVSAERSVASTDAQGVVSFAILPKVFLAAGTYFLMQQSGPANAQGCISEATPSPAGAENNFNLDAYADGPANPAGPVSIESKLYSISATVETATAFGKSSPGTSAACPPADFKYGNRYTLAESGTVSAITAYMGGIHDNTGGSQQFRTMIYGDDGPGGSPGTLLAASGVVTVAESAAPAYVEFPLSPAKALAAGTYWLLQQSGPASGKACLSQIAPSPGGTPGGFNPDAFADGPSNPAGPLTDQSIDYTLFAVYSQDAALPDTTRPTITGSRAPAANAAGWNNGSVVVSFTCADEPGGSGVASATAPTTLSADGAGQSVTGTCTDVAGNSATATVSGINIDKTAPTVAYTGNAGTYSLFQTVRIACSATDTLSGIASSTCANADGPAWSFGPGPNTLSATAADRADNTGSGSATFTVSVTPASLCTLIASLNRDEGRHEERMGRSFGDRGSPAGPNLCRLVAVISQTHNWPKAKRGVIAVMEAEIMRLVHDRRITAAQGAALVRLAESL